MIWLEAEQFDDRGGWSNDAQFVDQMGSPYLLALGLGEPVADAVSTIDVPQAGGYRLWARTKDWVPAHHPGRFRVALNGCAAEHVFGQSGKAGWHWEDGGVHALSGRTEVRLQDLTGYYGRCDVVVLSADVDWIPPAEVTAIAALRQRFGGVSREVQNAGDYDVVVVGGGLAGCTAAAAAARNGAKVALVQNRPVLGGNASTEILVPPVGVWPSAHTDPLDPRETGLVEEYRTEGNQKVSEGKLYEGRLGRWVKGEPNVALYLNTHANGVEMTAGEARRIAAVRGVDVNTGQRLRFSGRIFLDCTGDAVVGVAAGAEYRHGKEPRSLYNERWAPEVATPDTMGNGLKYTSKDMGAPQPFAAPPWAMTFPECDTFAPGRHPKIPHGIDLGYQWQTELGGTRDTYADAEGIRDELLRLVYGLWDHTKNHCLEDRQAATNHKLAWVGYVAGKRENRRLLGDYVLTGNDIVEQTLFPDRVAYGGWSMDDHHSEGFFYFGPPVPISAEEQYRGHEFSLPFRCLYSKNVENLLMAGRDISASHIALSDTRVMLTCAVIGHAAGTAAGLCLQKGATPRGLYQRHLAELQQQLLKEGAHLIGLPANDSRDLARQAAISASSEAAPAGNVTNGYARATDHAVNAWLPDPEAPAPHWVELSWEVPVTFNVVHVTFQSAKLAPGQFAVEAWQNGEWQPVVGVTENRHRRQVLGLDRLTAAKLRVVLDEPAGICEIRVYNEPPHVVESARRAGENRRLPDTARSVAERSGASGVPCAGGATSPPLRGAPRTRS